MTIGDFIRIRRKELDLTLDDISSACGVSKTTVLRWERGEITNMKRNRIEKLSEILRVSPVIFVNDTIEDYNAALKKPTPDVQLPEADIDAVTAEIVDLIQQMTDDQRLSLLQFVRSLTAHN